MGCIHHKNWYTITFFFSVSIYYRKTNPSLFPWAKVLPKSHKCIWVSVSEKAVVHLRACFLSWKKKSDLGESQSIFLTVSQEKLGFPGGISGKESTCQCRRPKRLGFNSWVGKMTWSRKWQSTPGFLPGKSHGQKSLAGYSPWGYKERDTSEWPKGKLDTRASTGWVSIFHTRVELPVLFRSTSQTLGVYFWH